MKPSDCRKFESITVDWAPEELSESQSDFVANHEKSCQACRMAYRAQVIGLDLLRGSACTVDATEISANFEETVVRNLRVQKKRDSWGYWWPAGLGAAIASLAAFAAMQLVSGSASFKPIFYRGQEARNNTSGIMRSLSTVREYNR